MTNTSYPVLWNFPLTHFPQAIAPLKLPSEKLPPVNLTSMKLVPVKFPLDNDPRSNCHWILLRSGQINWGGIALEELYWGILIGECLVGFYGGIWRGGGLLNVNTSSAYILNGRGKVQAKSVLEHYVSYLSKCAPKWPKTRRLEQPTVQINKYMFDTTFD